MRIATWYINSSLCIHHVLRFIGRKNINVMCPQEIKTPDEYFPRQEFKNICYKYQNYRGEKSYNGVAILSKIKMIYNYYINCYNKGDTKHICM